MHVAVPNVYRVARVHVIDHGRHRPSLTDGINSRIPAHLEPRHLVRTTTPYPCSFHHQTTRMSAQRIHLNPNAPRAPMMQGMGGGYQPDPIGNRKPQGQRSDNEVLARVQDVSSKVEDAIETYTQVSCLLCFAVEEDELMK